MSQVIPLLNAPIIARLYSPTDFGTYAVFAALSGILTSVASLALNHAIMVEKTPEDQAHTLQLAIATSFVFCLALTLAEILIPKAVTEYFLGAHIVPHLIWLPLTVFVAASYQALYSWTVRAGFFRILARNKVATTLTIAAVQVLIGLFAPSPTAFILANFIGICVTTGLLLALFLRQTKGNRLPFGLYSGLARLRRNSRFPLWTVPANLVNGLSAALPEFFVNRFFGAAAVGQFSMANKMLNLPVSFVAGSIQDIFRQSASQEVATSGHCARTFARFFLILGLVSLVLIVPLILALPFIFPIVLGHQWDQAGVLIQATSLVTLVRFIASPLSYVLIIRGHQRTDFYWQVGLLLITSAALAGPRQLGIGLPLVGSLWLYSCAVAAWYLVGLILSYRVAQARVAGAESGSAQEA